MRLSAIVLSTEDDYTLSGESAMTKGVLGIIICPMNDDYLIHSICTDKEVGRIVLLANQYSDRIKTKLEAKGAKFDVFPEYYFDMGNVKFDRDILNVVIKANDLALHAEPKDLKEHVEKQITSIQPLVDAVGLYYGLCGNFGWDITEWCKEKGFKNTAVFRALDGRVCDDCVAIAIGGTEKYKKLEREYMGMFYVTPAISDNWEVFVGAGDLGKQLKSISKETLEGLGIHSEQDYMRWLFELGHYENILMIDSGLGNKEVFENQVAEMGRTLNLKPIRCAEGWATLECAESLYNECKGYLS